MKFNILVIYTGGTFGMKKGEEGEGLTPSPRKDVFEKILKCYPNLYVKNEQKDFKLTLPEMEAFGQVLQVVYTVDELPGGKHLDSSNMKPEDWKIIANEIKKQYTSYDGFVVIMGTDTMTYTASGLSFLMTNLQKPVVITGAQISIFENRTDGVDNLLCALNTATTNIPEVMICFDKKVYLGNRTVKDDCDGFSAFSSPNMDPLVTLDVNMTLNVSRPSITTPLPPLTIADFYDTDKVGILLLYPGIDARKIKSYLDELDGVVLLTFGSGNAPSDIVKVLIEAAGRGVLIVNVTQCHKGSVSPAYEVGLALETNIISGGDMTTEAAFTKLLYVLGMKGEELRIKGEELGIKGELKARKMMIGKALRREMTDQKAKAVNNN